MWESWQLSSSSHVVKTSSHNLFRSTSLSFIDSLTSSTVSSSFKGSVFWLSAGFKSTCWTSIPARQNHWAAIFQRKHQPLPTVVFCVGHSVLSTCSKLHSVSSSLSSVGSFSLCFKGAGIISFSTRKNHSVQYGNKTHNEYQPSLRSYSWFLLQFQLA